jgi:peroxiredoxin
VRRLASWLAPVVLGVSAGAADIPRPAPDFDIPLTDGRVLKLASYRGKVVLVEFLLTTCPGCQVAARLLSQVQTQYGGAVAVLGVAINPGAEKEVAGFKLNYATTFPVGVRNNDAANGFLQIPIMSRMLMPQLVIIDKKGVIREQHGGEDMAFWTNEERRIHEAVQKYLAEGEPAAKKAAPKAVRKK